VVVVDGEDWKDETFHLDLSPVVCAPSVEGSVILRTGGLIIGWEAAKMNSISTSNLLNTS